MRRVLLLLQASLLSASCSQRPSVVVTLPNMPQQASSFSVLVSRDAWTPQGGAQAAAEQPTFDVSGFARTGEFSYRFGLHPPTGTSSRLSIGVGVFDRSGCLITTGVGDVAVSEMEVDQDVRVNLDAPPAEYMARCRKTTPTLRSAAQSADSAYTLEVSGWGFHPRAQLLLDDQPLTPTKWTWNSLTAPLPELKSPTGIRRATVTVKNPDGTSDSLAIVLNTLTFAALATNTYAVEAGRDAKSLAIADINKDGAPDVVIGGSTAGGTKAFVAVYLNLGGGRLPAQPDYYDFDGSGESVVARELNGDGLPDIALSSKSTSQVAVLYNDGRGKFPPLNIKRFPGGGQPDFLAAGDFDGDGKTDLVTGTQMTGTGSAVFVLFNQGTTFPTSNPPMLSAPGVFLSDLAFEDISSDGISDFILSYVRAGVDGNGQPVVVPAVEPIYHQSSGSLSTSGFYEIAGTLGRTAIGDLDGDGKKDLISSGVYVGTNQVDSNKLSVLFNTGTEDFRLPRVDVETLKRPYALTTADLNGDGKLDVAMTSVGIELRGQLGVHLNQGGGVLPKAADLPVYDIGFGSAQIASADFNGDGKADLVVVSQGIAKSSQPGSVTVFINTTR